MSLDVEDLVSGYGKIEIIHDISMHSEKGKITGIIGPNGAGKSTLLKSIFGLIKPWKGVVRYNGEDITHLKPHERLNRGFSYLLQRRSIFPYFSVEENLRLGAWLHRNEREKQQKLIERTYELFPILKEKRKEKARNLSGGMQRMLELGRSLILDPKILLIDEFSTGLAPKIAMSLYQKITELKSGHTEMIIVMVEQNVRQLMEVADYIYVLKLGKVVAEGPVEEFRTKLRDVVKDWLRY